MDQSYKGPNSVKNDPSILGVHEIKEENLSKSLAIIVGKDKMLRHEVIKKLHAVIKERKLVVSFNPCRLNTTAKSSRVL